MWGIYMEFQYKEYNHVATDEELIQDMKRVSIEKGTANLSMKDYKENGKYNCSTISRRFGTWNNALINAGISITQQYWTELDLYENLENVWRKKVLNRVGKT